MCVESPSNLKIQILIQQVWNRAWLYVFNELPDIANAAGPMTTLWVARQRKLLFLWKHTQNVWETKMGESYLQKVECEQREIVNTINAQQMLAELMNESAKNAVYY